MLFNPNWKSTPKPAVDITSLDTMIAWLKTKPRNGTYRYTDPTGCLCYQYLRAHGIPVISVGPCWWSETQSYHPLPKHFNLIAVTEPRTFGAALKRAKRARRKETWGF